MSFLSDIIDQIGKLIPTATYTTNFRTGEKNLTTSGLGSNNLINPFVSSKNAGIAIPNPTSTPKASMTPFQTPSPAPKSNSTSTSSTFGRSAKAQAANISPQVHSAIQAAAKEFNVPLDIMYDVAAHEGGFRADAKNETPEGQKVGVPVGLYQFTPGTWNGDLKNYASMPGSSLKNWNNPQREDPVANARAAAYLISHGQLARWEASKQDARFPGFGWGKYYKNEELKPYYSQSPGYQ